MSSMFEQLLADNVVQMPSRLCCMACGSKMTAPCGCGAPYVTLRERVRAALEEHPSLTNMAIARRLGCDETAVRRARKAMSAGAEIDPNETRIRENGRPYPAHPHHPKRKPAVKLFKARKVKGYKPPDNEKEQLIAFTRELSRFVMHFGIELRNWLDTEPTMDPAGREALSHTLGAFSMELQMLSQRVFDGGVK